MQQPVNVPYPYRRYSWCGYHGWCDESSPADAVLRSAIDPAALMARDFSGGRGGKKRNRLARIDVGGAFVWVKWFRPRGAWSWLRYAGRPTKAEKAWRLAFALLDAGIDTPRPLAGLQRRGHRERLDAVLVFEEFPDASHFAAALDDAGAARDDLLAAAARFLARFHDAGFRHRDLQGANLLVSNTHAGHAFSLVDINRARAHRRLTTAQRLRDLERLPLGPDDLEPFFAAYAGGNARHATASFRRRMRQRARLQRLPWPLNRIARRLWYYWREMTTFSPGRRP